MQTADRFVGQQLGSYRVERLLGRGRLSGVYLVRHARHEKKAALTTFIVPQHFSTGARQRFIQRFHKEAPILTSLEHPHLLPVYEHGEYDGIPYLVTPYMTLGSIADMLKKHGRCTSEAVLHILNQVAAGLDYAHNRGVFHGTLKPANLLLSEQQHILVAGSGLASIQQMRGIVQSDLPYAHLLNIAGTFLAAPEYIAPEVVKGRLPDARSDIYALGCILFELLSGMPPFTGEDPLEIAKQHVKQSAPSLRTVCPDLPIALTSVINQALDRDPDRRFSSVTELAEAFAQVSGPISGNSRPMPKVQNFLPATPQRRLAEEEQQWQYNTDEVVDSTARWLPPSSGQLRLPPPTTGPIQWRTEPLRLQTTSMRAPRPPARRTRKINRRQAIATLTTGGVIAAGAFVVANMNLAKIAGAFQNTGNQNQAMANAIGTTKLPLNSAMDFVNPVNKMASLLIHLPNGNFVAYEKACTHKGVYVKYDPVKHTLVCPAHDAVFDPAKGAAVLQGPATIPLPKVMLRINANGTITTA